jgi:hypothetical protein
MNSVILKNDVTQWKETTGKIKESRQELTAGEESAFEALCDYWRRSFDKTECEELITKLKSDANKHSNDRDLAQQLKEFTSLCTSYYTKTEVEFNAFQAELGGLRTAPPISPVSPVPLILKNDAAKWKEATRKIKESRHELTTGEESAFEVLCDYWHRSFDKTECEELITILKSDANKHSNNRDLAQQLKEFASLCTSYYTKTEVEFNAFQTELGGRRTASPISQASPAPHPATSRAVQTDSSGSQRINYINGDYYIGEVRNGLRHGHGKHFYVDGSWNEGNWVNDRLNGQAVRYIASNKRTDRGEFYDGQRTGHGVMEWENVGRYEGGWNDRGRHGQGVEYNAPNKRTDRGEYRDDKRAGRGTMEWENGDRYEGTWDDSSGSLNGQGTYYYAGGTIEKGRYVNGTWIKETSGGYRPPVAPSNPPPPKPSNYLALAILSTVFCWFGGVVSIVYAAKVNSLYAAGNHRGADRASRKAKGWAIGNIIVMIVLVIVAQFAAL